eukprot:TRINITY_DN5679_c0_g1_i1.p1 TRINITY_DN5679_c0_g1~~TRINITY_DN5679_c0_g1_i1.p1  ORF type:complete len:502 (-),score=128.68 TRINITY_DN5679_c0_g1_i1:8-1432(-)
MTTLQTNSLLVNHFEMESKMMNHANKRQKLDDSKDESLVMRIHFSKIVGSNDLQLSPMNEDVQTQPSDLRFQLNYNLQQWEQLHQREEFLIQQAKQYLANLELPSVNSESRHLLQQHHQFLTSEINSFLEHRTSTLGALLEVSNLVNSEKFSREATPEPEQLPSEIIFVQQPGNSVLVSKNITPAPSIEIRNMNKNASLALSVTIISETTEQEVDGLLQGTKRISLSSNGVATFSKLKINSDMVPKRSQYYSLLFSLEDYTNGEMQIVTSAKSDAFKIESKPTPRSTKRRRDDDDSKYYGSTSSDEDYVQSSPRERSYSEPTESRQSSYQDYNYVDITEFLTLPQKEAASKLGISESMLCKRFKECTRRKWPYRYIRKIDKVISLLCAHEGQNLSPEDKKKLDKLMREREERLQPVKIRITAHDRTLLPNTSSPSSPASPSMEETSSPADPVNFNDEEQFVLETLELLKTRRSP